MTSTWNVNIDTRPFNLMINPNNLHSYSFRQLLQLPTGRLFKVRICTEGSVQTKNSDRVKQVAVKKQVDLLIEIKNTMQ